MMTPGRGGTDGASRRVLVTGGAGFIGSNFVRHILASTGSTVTVLDKLTYAGNLANLDSVRTSPRLRFVKGDICDPEVVRPLVREADLVVNFAAETHVDRSIDDAGSFVRTDTYGVYVLLEASREARVTRFLQISTDDVYGESGETPCDDDPAVHHERARGRAPSRVRDRTQHAGLDPRRGPLPGALAPPRGARHR